MSVRLNFSISTLSFNHFFTSTAARFLSYNIFTADWVIMILILIFASFNLLLHKAQADITAFHHFGLTLTLADY